ncbi:MAG: Na+/H+ antiporter NhaA [Clostridium sartagoforme]|nr:Na+/H+ antiporter NhaA [Clostridium sartagoforme]
MIHKLKGIIKSEVFTGVLLIIATIVSLIIANSKFGEAYNNFFTFPIIGDFNIHLIINDFLMAIFFLFVGLEIKSELLYGRLSSLKKASFPIIAAIGGVLMPAIIFTIINFGTPFSDGIGIPISTDIAFAVGIFMILKHKVNPLLKIFLLSLAVVDDLISILVIGVVYSSHINVWSLLISVIILLILFAMNRNKVGNIASYLLVGLVLWFFIYYSGVHATISGVLLASAIPSKKIKSSKEPMLKRLSDKLEPLCNLLILPLFALSNTDISLDLNANIKLDDTLILGIIIGLVVGKPLGIMLFTWLGTKFNITEKPKDVDWLSVFSVSLLAGIGFTMSIFVSEIAFDNNHEFINISKISILAAAVISTVITYIVATLINFYKNKYKSKPNYNK